jgi:hypothetical protein
MSPLMGCAPGYGAGHFSGVGDWSWDRKKEVDLAIGYALALRMESDPEAFDRDRQPREGDLALLDGAVVDVVGLGLADDEVRRMFRDGELVPWVTLEWPPNGESEPLSN